MSTVGRRTGGFKKGGRINRGGSSKGKHFLGGVLMYARVSKGFSCI